MGKKISMLVHVFCFALILSSVVEVCAQKSELPKGKIDKDTKVRILSVERKKELVISPEYKFTAEEGKEFVVLRLEAQCPKGQKALGIERARTILVDSEDKQYKGYAEHSLPCYVDRPNDIELPFEVPTGINLRTLKVEDVSIDLESNATTTKGVEIRGRLIEENGEAARDLVVQLAKYVGKGKDGSSQFDLYMGNFPKTKSTKTDKDGRFTITEVAPGSYGVLTSRRPSVIMTSGGEILLWEVSAKSSKLDVGDVVIR